MSTTQAAPPRWDAAALRAFAATLFEQGGMEEEKAAAVAEILVEGDLMGHDTHGLALLGPYLDGLAGGDMQGRGRPTVLSATPVAETWEGAKLPGPWLVRRAADLASERAVTFGLAAVSIRRAHHIGCLAAYLPRIVERGQVLLIFSSDPGTASVAPWGGTRRIITPNPVAAGWPGPSGPVMIDVSMSITTNGMTGRRRAEGTRFPYDALLDAEGNPTDDPEAFFTEPAGTLLPLGGMAAGHKGFGLGLMVEALTSALGGYGRADPPAGWGASVLVLVIDPARFGGTEAFLREAGWMEQAVRGNPPARGGPPPRLPGERAWQRRAAALAEGVALHPSIPPVLAARAAAAGLAVPLPLA
ncbi:Ldh family oxidoreductase [Paracraurococcus lichenis]|uniref:Ldh family oxidoreductase n=1 Tax=Paracraurococcus lichenis TaxID=3064888 RepID=A0ABT9DYY5_9PROT|nr:Ldh family oxidoreductase [Paracraurococcus sp. LOR1-02]MDO9709119.1 Ldh family oxidoreductase [Paracraurococcus sp. LOR1-02]